MESRTGDRSRGRLGLRECAEDGPARWLPDHTAERRAEYRRTTPGQRVAETIAISRTTTKLAEAAYGYASLRPNALEDDVPGIGRGLFAGYDDVVTMKRTAGRPLDLADLHVLERVRQGPEP
jgi:hypothetical protein